MQPAHAQTPTDIEISQIKSLLGFTPDVTRKVVRASFDSQPELKRYDAAQQDCLLDALQPEVEGKLSEAFGDLFEDSETVAAWLRFAGTPGGAKLTGAMRAGVDAMINGGTAPNPFGTVSGMTAAERADVAAFMESPAAGVLKKDFPDLEKPVAFGQDAARKCGIDEWNES
ncbi:hypothetical protein M2650_03360 [Luteimonas sp. SX5]|uniref:DUF2059 domain-containing protein n=2 Tax=Luteimonas galliterrae TaxID=2940486 RepID=A0ABT0MG93_9GAMM|nr:hypothetical protein [Luteimonas galliterrae]